MSGLRSIADMISQPALAFRPAGDSTDRELLQRFVASRDEIAFAALVQRHGGMVLRVCRRVLASEQDAEDVCQATFLTLARKAAVVPWQDSVKCWLHSVARRLALQARCSASRRSRLAPEASPGERHELLERCDTHDDPLAEV